MVSVIMPAYNVAKTIMPSIESVTAQTYENWELIVIDDGSSDGTPELVRRISELDFRVRYYQNEDNLGVAETRNRGMSLARGEWIAFLDSDDLWRDDKLEKQMQFVSETGAVISYTGTSYINESGNVYSYVLRATQTLSYKTLLHRNIMSCSSVVVRKDFMIPFPLGDIHEDYVVWLQILKKVAYAYGIDEPLLMYRMSAHSKSAGRFHSALMTYNAYRHVGYGILTSMLFTLRYALHSISKRFLIRFRRIHARGRKSV